jgi:hypothetical protein
MFLRRNQLPSKKTIVPLLTFYILRCVARVARVARSSSRISAIQFVMSRYGNFTKEIARSGQLSSIPDV